MELILNPEDAINEPIIWESSNSTIFEVDNDGNIKGINEGTATITATTKYSGLKITNTIEVEKEKFEIVFKDINKTEIRESGQVMGTLPTITKETYKFLGWYTALTGGKKVTEQTVVEENMTLYPHWEKLYVITSDSRYNSYETVVFNNTPTLKYRILRYQSSYVVLVWVEDASKQLKQGLASANAYGTAPAEYILGGVSKSLVAVNGGLFDYNTPHSGAVIHDGKVVKNKGNTVGCMGINKEGKLVDCTHRSANDLVNMGILNNFAISHSFDPTKGDGAKATALRTQVCQVDLNNFVMVSTSSMRTGDAARLAYSFSGNKCSVVHNLDGGGSRKLYYRKANGSLVKQFGGSRAITDMLYFVEQ